MPDNQNSLRAGVRGPTLLEDFILREKITHFDHERIPERIGHARQRGACTFMIGRMVLDAIPDNIFSACGWREGLGTRLILTAGGITPDEGVVLPEEMAAFLQLAATRQWAREPQLRTLA